MRESLSKIKNGLGAMVRLARALPAFFRDRITLSQAEAEIKKDLARRGENFLETGARADLRRPGESLSPAAQNRGLRVFRSPGRRSCPGLGGDAHAPGG